MLFKPACLNIIAEINIYAELLAANMKHLHTFAGLLALGLSVGYGKGEEAAKPPPARAAVVDVKQQTPKPTKPKAKKLMKQKVLFLTNSTFHAHGGCMVPFNGYCTDAGVDHVASGSYKNRQVQVLSTEGMMKYAKNSSSSEFVVATETGILYRMKQQNPEKTFVPASEKAECQYMKMITLEKVYDSLVNEKYEIKVPKNIALKARLAIDRMLSIS